jgi:hypothetical protein
MCFYELLKFDCGEWKWGNLKQRCNEEYRMGETCGMKLVFETLHQPTKCRLCEKYHTKLRKREAECERIKRWQSEGKSPANAEKAYASVSQLDNEIHALCSEINKRRINSTVQRAPEYSYYDTIGTRPPSHPPEGSQNSTGTSRFDSASSLSSAMAMMNLDGERLREVSTDLASFRSSSSQYKAWKGQPEPLSASAATLHNKAPPSARKVYRPSHRDSINIILDIDNVEKALMACADSGSCVNAMSFQMARKLGISFQEHGKSSELELALPNGSVIRSSGSFHVECSIVSRSGEKMAGLWVEFVIFKRFHDPSMLIMGDDFLDELDILKRPDDFLIPTPTTFDSPQIRSLGHSPKLFKCCFEGRQILAFLDTGAEVDCISKSFARKECQMVQKTKIVTFADGGRATSTHIVKGRLSIGWQIPSYEEVGPSEHEDNDVGHDVSSTDVSTNDDPINDAHPTMITKDIVDIEFHTIENLSYDFILGGRSLDALKAYELHEDEFVYADKASDASGSMCRIFSWPKRQGATDSEGT